MSNDAAVAFALRPTSLLAAKDLGIVVSAGFRIDTRKVSAGTSWGRRPKTLAEEFIFVSICEDP
jgi:hypothetical protein